MIFSIILIIPAFILWGVPEKSKGKKYKGIIAGRKVPWQEYYKSLRTCERQAILAYGDKFNQMRKDLKLEEQAWQRLILLEKAKKQGVKIEDKEVIAAIKKIPLFQNEEGFDKKKYNQILEYLKIKPRKFEEEIRETLKISKSGAAENSAAPDYTD